MKSQKKILLPSLDKQLALFKEASKIGVPAKGWVHTLREGLNMTLEQLASKVGLTKQGVKKIEEREVEGSISLNAMREISTAMEMKLVYGFVPVDGTLENLIDKKAKALAKKIVLRTQQQMKLENQGTGKREIEKAIHELAEEMKREMRRSLWD